MTQAELAEKCGITRQTVIAIERGHYTPSVETAFRIVRALGATFEDVFHYPHEGSTTTQARGDR